MGSWENHEDALTSMHIMNAPPACNSTARIGPLSVEIKERPLEHGFSRAYKAEGAQTVWWNGNRWSAKRPGGKGKRYVPFVNVLERNKTGRGAAPKGARGGEPQPPQTARPQSARPTPRIVRPNSAGASRPNDNKWQTNRPRSAARTPQT